MLCTNQFIYQQIEETSFDRLCQSKKILTVNGQFPGPTIYALAGETLSLDVENRGKDNVTMFWYKDSTYHCLFTSFVTFGDCCKNEVVGVLVDT